MNNRLALERYIYEDIYPAFKAATDEKEKTAAINRAFLNCLAEQNLVLAGNKALLVADIGSGPCDTLIKYLTGVRFPPGFDVRATDFLPEYAGPDGVARRNVAAAEKNGILKLAGFSAKTGNAFEGELIELVSSPDDCDRPRGMFRLAFASHMVYHAESTQDVERLVADVASNLLAKDGIAIFYHAATTPQTFQEFRARFGSQAGGNARSDTGAVTIDDPTAQIRHSCARTGVPLYELEFSADLRFGALGNHEWNSFKAPLSYERLAVENPGAYEDLKRLYFVVQRAPLEFAADKSRTGLPVFIDEIRPVIERNKGILRLAERMQVFTPADTASNLATAIPHALAAAQSAQTHDATQRE
jgi:hypothetical protein